jgi:hypothetical protein
MRRLGLAIIVALLTFSASGAPALIVDEPCTGYEQSAGDEGDCPPTCVTCGCCAQAVEAAILPIALASSDAVVQATAFVRRIPKTRAHEILHVPKFLLA